MKAGRRSPVALVLALALLLLYGGRTVTGWIGGVAYSKGSRLASAGRFEQALPEIERGALGPERAAMLWLAGEARLGHYQARVVEGATEEELDELLRGAFSNHSEAITLSPASGWYWSSLADVYHQRERRFLYRFGRPLDLLGQDRWAFVGRDGRIALGMMRMAIEREPTQYVFLDQIAFALLDYGMREQALEAVRESARVQPNFGMHAYRSLNPLPGDVLDAFTEGARSALGKTPLMPRVIHLLALGRLELRRGNATQAERDLREAVEIPGTGLNRADAFYRLGQALQMQARYDEAIEAFLEAETDPIFEPLGIRARAAIAEERGELELSLKLLRRARRLRPAEIDYALTYARIAIEFGRLDWAEESLRWARTKHPRDPRPVRMLIGLRLEQRDGSGVESLRRELERLENRSSSAATLGESQKN
jgi:tetratricopeptide (TPR) repeat protein